MEYFGSAKFKRASARHQYDCQRAIRKDVLVGLGQSIIGEVSRREWMDTVRNVEKRGSHAAAHQLFVYLKTFLNWAEDQGYLELNPIARAKYDKPAVKRQRKSLSEEELKTFWNGIDRGRAGSPCSVILKLALLTGQRIGEIAGMTRDEVDLSSKTWVIPANRTKNRREHRVPLGPLAESIISNRMANTNNLHLFPADHANANSRGIRLFVGSDTIGAYLRDYHKLLQTAEKERWTAHELRHSFVTRLNELGVQPHIVEALVNHVSGTMAGVAGVYNHAGYETQKRETMEKWEEWFRINIIGDLI